MPKKVTEKQKKEISDAFVDGVSIKEISLMYDFSIITITNQLKKILGKDIFEQIKNKDFRKEKSAKKKFPSLEHETKKNKDKSQSFHETQDIKFDNVENFPEQSFFEVIPICNIRIFIH